jgi:hypothetical protein
MDSLPVALILATRVAREESGSALPNAPVVPHVDRVSVVHRTRKAVAVGLLHLADAIAPARPVRHTPARSGMSRTGMRGEAG